MNLPVEVQNLYNSLQWLTYEKNRVANILQGIDPSRSKRIRDCGTRQVIAYNQLTKVNEVVFGEYCDDRLCPVCQKHLHSERASKLSFMVHGLAQKGYNFTFWTFSPAVSCTLENLKQTSRGVLKLVNQVIKHFFNDDNLCEGYWLNLEFTKHKHKRGKGKFEYVSNNCVYHPHIHVLFAFRKPSIEDCSKIYDPSIFKSKGQKLWDELSAECEKKKFPYVRDITQFMIDYVNEWCNSKNKLYEPIRMLRGTRGICYAKNVDINSKGWAFELTKYIAVSKNFSDDNLKEFMKQIDHLSTHRGAGVLHWDDRLKDDYKSFIQNENCKKFPVEWTSFYLYRYNSFNGHHCEPITYKDFQRIKTQSDEAKFIKSRGDPFYKFLPVQQNTIKIG